MGRLSETAESIKKAFRQVEKFKDTINGDAYGAIVTEKLRRFEVVGKGYNFNKHIISSIETHLKKAYDIITEVRGEGEGTLKIKYYINPLEVDRLVNELVEAHRLIKALLAGFEKFGCTGDYGDTDVCIEAACNLMLLYVDIECYNGETTRQLLEDRQLTCSELMLLCNRSISGIWE